MRLGQTSIEYLLLTAGVILTAVVAGNYVVHSGVQVQHTTAVEANKIMTIHDTIPPTTTMMCNGTSCFTKYDENVKISFVCQDNLQGTGCKETHYQINGGTWNVCTQPNGCKNVATLAKPAAGSKTYTVTFYSVDMNGNVEKKRTITITIGGSFSATHACSISFSPQFPKPGDTVQVTATASAKIYDAEISVKIGGTTVAQKTCGDMLDGQSCSISFVPSKEGQYAVTVSAKDSFGNSGVCGSASINVDGTAPAVTFKSPDPCKWYNKDFTVNVNATDGPNPGSSLMNQWKYDVWDAKGHYTSGWLSMSPVQSTSENFNVKVGSGEWCSEQGKSVCNVQAEFKDRAGNTGTATEKYSIDYTPPTVTVTLPAAGWVNHSIDVGIHCKDSPSNGAGCKAIYWAFVDPDQPCPSPGSSGWQKKTFSPTGCPEQYPMQADATAVLDCELCAKDICYYAEDGAGNISKVGRSTVTNPNGNPSDGSYAIDKIPPSCQVSLSSEPVVANGSASGTDWRMGGIGGYKFDIICNDQSNGSGLADVKISIANPNCGGCQLSCSMEPDVRTLEEWATGGGEVSSTATSAEFAISPSPYATAFHCTVDATAGSVCTASGITVTAKDWAGNSATFSGSANIKLDAMPPKPSQTLVSTNPASPVCGKWYKTFTIKTTGTESGATSCNSGLYEYIAQVSNGSASPSSKKFSFTASETIPQVVVSTPGEGEVCIISDYHDAVSNANRTGQICKYLDDKPPSLTLTTDKSLYYVGEQIQATATATDGGSGVHAIVIAGAGRTYPCNTHTATMHEKLGATCQDAVAGFTVITAMASDYIGNETTASKKVTVNCKTNADCSCLDEITCSGLTEIDWAGSCNTTCSKKKVGTYDCSTLSCPDTTTCSCSNGKCTETIYHYTPGCVSGSGCTCLPAGQTTMEVPACSD